MIPLKKPDSRGVASIFQPMRLMIPHPSPPPLGEGWGGEKFCALHFGLFERDQISRFLQRDQMPDAQNR